MSAQPWNELFRLLKYETSPPFIFVLAYLVQQISSSVILLKAINLVPVLLSAGLILKMARKIIGSRGAIATAAILASSGLLILVSETFRMHSWLLLWSTLATVLVFRILDWNGRETLHGLHSPT